MLPASTFRLFDQLLLLALKGEKALGVEVCHMGVEVGHMGVEVGHMGVEVGHMGLEVGHMGLGLITWQLPWCVLLWEHTITKMNRNIVQF